VGATVRAASATAASIETALKAAARSLAPTAQGLPGEQDLLRMALSSTGICRRFVTAAHSAATQLVTLSDHARWEVAR